VLDYQGAMLTNGAPQHTGKAVLKKSNMGRVSSLP